MFERRCSYAFEPDVCLPFTDLVRRHDMSSVSVLGVYAAVPVHVNATCAACASAVVAVANTGKE
jgi:hypothetical protein